MGVSSELSEDGNQLIISIEGRFDFSFHQDFRSAYENDAISPSNYVVDLSETTYLDSSALGMLLLLRDFAGGDRSYIQIMNANADVKKILAISNFEQLFDIH